MVHLPGSLCSCFYLTRKKRTPAPPPSYLQAVLLNTSKAYSGPPPPLSLQAVLLKAYNAFPPDLRTLPPPLSEDLAAPPPAYAAAVTGEEEAATPQHCGNSSGSDRS